LLDLAEAHWTVFDGWTAKRGVDPMQLPFHRFLSLLYFWVIENADEQEREKFDVKLNMPLPGKPKIAIETGPWSAAAETSALSGLAAATGAAR
jgi:hypothetical protein